MATTSSAHKASRTDEVYLALRREITKGIRRPNEPLIEVEIAEQLGVSRTPVRESLQRLASDGLIISRRRRWMVYEHTSEEIREHYELRAGLEGWAARLGAGRATDAQREELAAQRPAEGEEAERTLDGRVDANERFHDCVSACSNNQRLLDQIQRNRLVHFNHRVAALYSPDDLVQSSAQHRAIVDAILAGDGPAAEEAARGHVQYSLDLMLNKLY